MTPIKLLLATSMLALPGCMSTSFAPPRVNMTQLADENSLSRECRPQPLAQAGEVVTHNVAGALALIQNFVTAYRCTVRVAANGRQGFQLPSFVALVGSAAAVAFGAGREVAIAGGVTNQVFTAGNSYYAPAEQAQILRDALGALTCIQTEAVGVPAFSRLQAQNPAPATSPAHAPAHPAAGGSENGASALINNDDPDQNTMGSIEVTSAEQYFNMISAALVSVETAAAQRLSRRGSYDAAGVVAQIQVLAQREDAATTATQKPGAASNMFFMAEGTISEPEYIQLQLSVLQPRLDRCVLRAQI